MFSTTKTPVLFAEPNIPKADCQPDPETQDPDRRKSKTEPGTTRLHKINTDSNHILMAEPKPEDNLVKICDNLWLQMFGRNT